MLMPQSIDVDVNFKSSDWNAEMRSLAERCVLTALRHVRPELTRGEVSVVFADDAFVRALNKEHRQKNAPTNVLSFPQMEPDELDKTHDFIALGDIILAYETVHREAQEQSKSFSNHTAHLIVHSSLHLLGHDHMQDKAAEEMETLEIEIMRTLGIKNPYVPENSVP